MIRQNEGIARVDDAAHQRLWERATTRQQQRIESRFLESLGGDLIAEAESAQSSGTPEKFAELGRWVASAWLSYRDEQLDRLASEGMLG
jgi:hypothetical protein